MTARSLAERSNRVESSGLVSDTRTASPPGEKITRLSHLGSVAQRLPCMSKLTPRTADRSVAIRSHSYRAFPA